jgi:hypothetical protein
LFLILAASIPLAAALLLAHTRSVSVSGRSVRIRKALAW